MSQTETLLLFVLGFSLAALLALFLSRFLWAAALRLGARRMQKQVPSTVVGLQTERDRLRAEYAMISQRLGSRLEATKLKMAEQMAEVVRHRNRIEELESRIAERDVEISNLQQKSEQLTSDLAASVVAREEMDSTLAERQSAIDALQLQIADLMQAPSEPVLELAAETDPQTRIRQHIGKLNQLAKDVIEERNAHRPTLQAVSDPLVREQLGEAERQTADIQKELETLDAEWSKRLGELQDQEQTSKQGQTGTGAVANVISLANRIRDLHKDINNG